MGKFKTPKAIYIRVDDDLHHEVKKLCLFQHKTLERWVTEAVIEKLTREKSYLKDGIIPE